MYFERVESSTLKVASSRCNLDGVELSPFNLGLFSHFKAAQP
jgi:hypothetical protein